MRTALVTWNYPPWPSGLATAAGEIAESLALAGVDVTVFDLGRTGSETRGGIRIVGCAIPEDSGLAGLRLWGGAGHLAAPIAFRAAVLTEHQRQPFDVVEATNWYAPAVLLARHPKMAIVTRNSTPAAFSRDRPSSVRDRIDAAMADRLERSQARRSHGLISNTAEHARRVGIEYGLQDGDQPHGVIALSLSPDMIARGKAAPYPGVAVGEPVRVLFVGRAEHRKGFDALIECVEILAREVETGQLPDFELRLAGVDQAMLPPGLSPAARRRVQPLGSVSADVLGQEYAGAHAVAAPSRYESFGLVYQEGIAFGRPMIASNEDASARAFVGAVGAGSMAEATTGPALADAMRPILGDPALRLALRAKALAAAGRFDRQMLGTETLALYRAAIERFQAR